MAAGSQDPDRDHHSGARGLMDKVTGRSGHDHTPDHTPTGTTTDDRVIASPTGTTDTTSTQTDLTATEQTSTSGRHRDEI